MVIPRSQTIGYGAWVTAISFFSSHSTCGLCLSISEREGAYLPVLDVAAELADLLVEVAGRRLHLLHVEVLTSHHITTYSHQHTTSHHHTITPTHHSSLPPPPSPYLEQPGLPAVPCVAPLGGERPDLLHELHVPLGLLELLVLRQLHVEQVRARLERTLLRTHRRRTRLTQTSEMMKRLV